MQRWKRYMALNEEQRRQIEAIRAHEETVPEPPATVPEDREPDSDPIGAPWFPEREVMPRVPCRG